jgi:hypothetical protein
MARRTVYYNSADVLNRFPDYRDGSMHNGPVPPFGYNPYSGRIDNFNKYDPFNTMSELSHGSLGKSISPFSNGLLNNAFSMFPVFKRLSMDDSDDDDIRPRRRRTVSRRRTTKRKTRSMTPKKRKTASRSRKSASRKSK